MDGESGCMRVERLENHSIALFELSMTLRYWIQPPKALAGAFVISLICLLAGHSSQAACNFCVTLPAIILSCKKLTNINTTFINLDDLLKLQENILIYWTVQGIFNVLDNILWKGPDYFCVKFILLSLLFSFLTSDKANLKNKDEENSANLNDATSHLQSILTTVDYTQYTTSCSAPNDSTIFDKTTLSFNSYISSKAASVREDAGGGDSMRTIETDLYSTNSVTDIDSLCSSATSDIISDLSIRTANNNWLSKRDENQINIMVPCSNEESSFRNSIKLFTNPSYEIIFNVPCKKPVPLVIENHYKHAIMWTLKTNAVEKITGFPNHGILQSGDIVSVEISLVGDPAKFHGENDRLIIDYDLADATIENFNQSTMHRKKFYHRRKGLKVTYKN
ncbi:unnamed protein product [Dracunculus medinensis]|uniref:Major sperm protein n=1 Tax=Dracunculus medinensis TaxID=318479 RepID=A0A0N4UND1_DRAME|nr:unnamed protein product [Dracunculus medinensis]